jgi:hypothetical protein
VNDELVRTRKDVEVTCCKILSIYLPGATEVVTKVKMTGFQSVAQTSGLPNMNKVFIDSTTTFSIQHSNNIQFALFTEFDPK